MSPDVVGVVPEVLSGLMPLVSVMAVFLLGLSILREI